MIEINIEIVTFPGSCGANGCGSSCREDMCSHSCDLICRSYCNKNACSINCVRGCAVCTGTCGTSECQPGCTTTCDSHCWGGCSGKRKKIPQLMWDL